MALYQIETPHGLLEISHDGDAASLAPAVKKWVAAQASASTTAAPESTSAANVPQAAATVAIPVVDAAEAGDQLKPLSADPSRDLGKPTGYTNETRAADAAALAQDNGTSRPASALATAGQSLYEGIGTAVTGLSTIGRRIDEALVGGTEAEAQTEMASLQSTIAKGKAGGLDVSEFEKRAADVAGRLRSFGQADAVQRAGEAARGVGESFEPNPAYKGEFLAEALPQVAGSVGSSMAQLATLAGPATLFGQFYQTALERNLAKGIDLETAHGRALREGIASGGLEAVGEGIVAGVAGRLAKLGGKALSKSKLFEAATAGAAEFFTESGQNVISNVVDEEKIDWAGAAKAGGLGILGAGLVIGPAAVAGRIADSVVNAKVSKRLTAVSDEALSETANDPEAMAALPYDSKLVTKEIARRSALSRQAPAASAVSSPTPNLAIETPEQKIQRESWEESEAAALNLRRIATDPEVIAVLPNAAAQAAENAAAIEQRVAEAKAKAAEQAATVAPSVPAPREPEATPSATAAPKVEADDLDAYLSRFDQPIPTPTATPVNAETQTTAAETKEPATQPGVTPEADTATAESSREVGRSGIAPRASESAPTAPAPPAAPQAPPASGPVEPSPAKSEVGDISGGTSSSVEPVKSEAGSQPKPPEQMTPEEHARMMVERDAAKGLPDAQRALRGEITYTVSADGQPIYPVTGQGETSSGSRNTIRAAVEQRAPINAALYDGHVSESLRPIALPEGYVKRGDLYVHEPTSAAPAIDYGPPNPVFGVRATAFDALHPQEAPHDPVHVASAMTEWEKTGGRGVALYKGGDQIGAIVRANSSELEHGSKPIKLVDFTAEPVTDRDGMKHSPDIRFDTVEEAAQAASSRGFQTEKAVGASDAGRPAAASPEGAGAQAGDAREGGAEPAQGTGKERTVEPAVPEPVRAKEVIDAPARTVDIPPAGGSGAIPPVGKSYDQRVREEAERAIPELERQLKDIKARKKEVMAEFKGQKRISLMNRTTPNIERGQEFERQMQTLERDERDIPKQIQQYRKQLAELAVAPEPETVPRTKDVVQREWLAAGTRLNVDLPNKKADIQKTAKNRGDLDSQLAAVNREIQEEGVRHRALRKELASFATEQPSATGNDPSARESEPWKRLFDESKIGGRQAQWFQANADRVVAIEQQQEVGETQTIAVMKNGDRRWVIESGESLPAPPKKDNAETIIARSTGIRGLLQDELAKRHANGKLAIYIDHQLITPDGKYDMNERGKLKLVQELSKAGFERNLMSIEGANESDEWFRMNPLAKARQAEIVAERKTAEDAETAKRIAKQEAEAATRERANTYREGIKATPLPPGRKGKITLASEEGAQQQVDATIHGIFAIRKVQITPRVPAKYSITHVPSGKRVLDAPTLGQAKEYIQAIIFSGAQLTTKTPSTEELSKAGAVVKFLRDGGEPPSTVDSRSVVAESATTPVSDPTSGRIAEIDAELAKLQAQYEKKSSTQSRGSMVPPPIKASALSGITKQMDKLDAERKSLLLTSAPESQAPTTPKDAAKLTRLKDEFAEVTGEFTAAQDATKSGFADEDTPAEIASLERRAKALREKIAKATPDRIESALNEAIDALAPKPGRTYADPLFIQSIGKPTLRAALQVARAAYRSGKAIAEAVEDAIAYLRAQVKGLDEAKARAFFADEEVMGLVTKAETETAAPNPTIEPPTEPSGDAPQNKIGGYNADVEAHQKARGQTPTMSEARKEDPVTWQNAMDEIERNPVAPEALVERIHRDPKKPITDEEQQMLTWQRATLEDRMAQEAERAVDPTITPEEQASHQTNAELYEAQLLRTEQANRIAGTSAGRTLRSRQLEMNEDYTFAGLMMRRRKLTGEVVPKEMAAQIRVQAAEIAAAKVKVAELDAAVAEAKLQAEKVAVLEATIADLEARPKWGKGVFDVARSVVARWQAEADAIGDIEIRDFLGSESGAVGGVGGPKGEGRGLAEQRAAKRMFIEKVAIKMRAKVGSLGLDFAEASAEMISEFGAKIKPYLQPAWVRMQRLIDKEKTTPKVKSAIKEGVAKPKKGEKTLQDIAARALAEASAKMPLGHKTAYEAVRAVINSGVKGELEIMQAAHDLLTPAYPDLTLNELDVKFTDYGNAKYPSTEANKVALAKQRTLRQMQAAIDDVKRRGETAKSGVQRAKADEDVRKRQSELRDAIEKYGKEVPTSPEQLANRERARLSAAENAIEDLDRELKTGEAKIRANPKMPSAELEQLQSELAAMRELKKEIADAENPGLTPEKRAEATAIKEAERSIARLNRRIIEEELVTPKRDPRAPLTPRLEALHAERDAMRQYLKEMQDAAKPVKSDAQKQVESLTKIRERLSETLAGTRPPNAPKDWTPLTQASEDIKAEIIAMQELAAQLRREARPATDPNAAREKAQIAALEKAIERYRQKTADLDISTKGKTQGPDTRKIAALKEIRDSRRSMYQSVTRHQRYNSATARRLETQLLAVQARLAAKDFAPRPKKVPPVLTKANLDAKAELEAKKNEVKRGEEQYRLEHRTKMHKIWDGIRQTNLARTNIISSLDLSAPRQGLVYLLTSGTRIATNPGMILRPFRNMFQSLVSEKLAQRIDQKIKGRTNRTNGVDKLADVQFQDINNSSFTRGEENAHSILDEWAKTSFRTGGILKTAALAVPRAGAKAVHMSNRAFATFLNTARAELLDHLLKVNFMDRPPTEAQIRSIGDMVNLATGRGNMSREVSNSIGFAGLWSPHLLVSRLQLLTGQPLVGAIVRGEGRAAKIVAKEYARIIASGYILYMISRLFNEDEDKESTSSDAGKIIRTGEGGDTRVDLWGGFQQQLVLEERFRKRESTSIDGTTRSLSGRDLLLIGAKFYRSKLRPDVALAADILLGENYKGDKTTLFSVAKSLAPIPLSMTELLPLLKAHGLTEAAALEAIQLFGAGVNNYADDEHADRPRPR